jgi:predicted pyridoxine 5'-phosphate oxidase superfamily flavin-nucleotide-binding protein
MGSRYDVIDARMARFLGAQPVFFVATAPLDGAGHVNCSPKGNDGSFAVLGERRVGYLDFTGSGIETIAHLRENGRIVVMFCAFGGPPRIVRLHGTGEVVALDDPRFDELASNFTPRVGARAVVVVEVDRITDSCGYGVPLMEFQRHRDNMEHWVETKGGEAGVARYRAEKNALSVDGLPGYPLRPAEAQPR